MLLYAVMYEDGEWDDYQQWVHIIYDNVDDAAQHLKDALFSDVKLFALNCEHVFRDAAEASAYYERLYRTYRSVDPLRVESWFDDSDNFLGYVEKVYYDGSHSLQLRDVRIEKEGNTHPHKVSQAPCAILQGIVPPQ